MTGDIRSWWVSKAAWAALCIFVFSIPWEKSIQLPGATTLSHMLGVVAFGAAAAVAWRRGSVRRPNLALVLAGMFVVWAALTWIWSIDRHATVARVTTLVELLAMTVLIWDCCRDKSRQRQLMQAYVLGAVAASASAYFRYFNDMQTYWRRYAAAGFDPNDFGLILAISIPLALYLAMRGGLAGWLNRLAVVVIIGAVLLTASRMAMVTTFAAFAFPFLAWKQAGWSHRAASVLLLAVMVLGVFRFAPAPARQRLSTITTELTKGTLHNRTTIWKTGLKIFPRHAVAGIGAGAYPEAVKPVLGVPGVPGHFYVAHNTFLSVLVECGAVGFAFYGLMLSVAAFYIWTMQPAERALWAVILAVWAIGVSTLTWEQYKPSWLILALIMTEWALPWRQAGPNE
ncbi:MAG: O-antigen ligase family protein [Bryobacteraceae bacterium]|nr:O-antigen ligase family protein [Bryobacteraceae bacterium]